MHPGIKNARAVSRPSKKASSTVSTGPQVFGITLKPAEMSIDSAGREMAPQMSTSGLNSVSLLTFVMRSSLSMRTSRFDSPARSSIVSTQKCLATSNTGEILPSYIGTATRITLLPEQTACQNLFPNDIWEFQ